MLCTILTHVQYLKVGSRQRPIFTLRCCCEWRLSSFLSSSTPCRSLVAMPRQLLSSTCIDCVYCVLCVLVSVVFGVAVIGCWLIDTLSCLRICCWCRIGCSRYQLLSSLLLSSCVETFDRMLVSHRLLFSTCCCIGGDLCLRCCCRWVETFQSSWWCRHVKKELTCDEFSNTFGMQSLK